MGEPITVWRTALHQTRPYLDLTDALEGIMFIMRTNLFDRRIYNVLTTNASVKSILDIISLHVPDISIRYVDTPIMNQLSYRVSNDRFRDNGFEFRGSLERGINETIQLLEGVRTGDVHARRI